MLKPQACYNPDPTPCPLAAYTRKDGITVELGTSFSVPDGKGTLVDIDLQKCKPKPPIRKPQGNKHLKYEINGNVATIFIESKKLGIMQCLVDTEDLSRVLNHQNTWCCTRAMCKGKYYERYYAACRSNENRRYVSLHRFVLNINNSIGIIDHKNGNGLDCRKENMRVTDTSGNMLNRIKLSSNNTSGYTGVSWNLNRKKWRAVIMLRNKQIHLGYFDNPYEASLVVEKKRLELL